MNTRKVLFLFVLLSACLPARAVVLRVAQGAPGPVHDGATWRTAFGTVQAALEAAAPGAEVWVSAGAFPESVTVPVGVALYGGFNGAETARDQRDPRRNTTVLQGAPDPSRTDPTVRFEPEATPLTVLDGFVIRTRAGEQNLQGIVCLYASPTIRNNVVRGATGFGIRLFYTNAVVESNRIEGNGTQGRGGGGLFSQYSSPTIRNNVIAANGGPGIFVETGAPDIRNNTIVSNGATVGGGIYVGSDGAARLVNNIVAFNASGIAVFGAGTAAMSHNCVYDNGLDVAGIPDPFGANGNVRDDPRLADAARGDLHIQPNSPCVDAGDNEVAPDARDVDGQPRVQGARVDIGADESDGGIRPPLPPVIVRVRPDGNDAGDGATWATAKQTVQAAVDAAAPFGGEVWTAAGVYRETLTVPPYAYIYGGFAGGETRREQRDPRPGGAVLDGGGETVVSIPAGHRVSRLDSFLLRNGGRGGGIWTGAAGPAIENNTILGAVFSGGAMTLRNNHIVGGVSGLAADISNNLVTGSLSDGISTGGSGVPTRVANNVVRGNGTNGIAIQGAADVVNNTVAGNGGAGFRSSQGRSLVANNIFAGNGMGISARDIYGQASSAIIAAWSNCLFNNGAKAWDGLPNQTGVNRNIGKDPLLAAPEYGDFHIQPASPCWGTGDNLSVMPGEQDMDGQPRILGRAVDIGADESDGTTWNTGPARLHVRTDGSDGADGRTWATAMQTLSLAASGAPGGEVWVAAGTYAGAGLTLNGVALYGGFNGTETQRDQRDPRANATVLDGERKGSVVIVPPFAPETTVLDGFTVQNGDANHGGGVLLLEVSRAVVSNNVIRNNTAIRGGGIMVEMNAAPMISHNIITGNGSAGGGGIEFWTNGNGTVKDNVITGNSGMGSGVFISQIYGDQSGPFITNNTIPDLVEVWASGPVVTNNILGNPGVGIGEWRFNLFMGDGNAPADTSGNIYATDAGFVNAAVGDYRLRPDSRAINAGDNTVVAAGDTDLGGKPRIADGWVDMGAYEYAPTGYTVGDAAAALRLAAGLSSATPDLAARLNVDNTGASKDVVDLADAIRLAALSVD